MLASVTSRNFDDVRLSNPSMWGFIIVSWRSAKVAPGSLAPPQRGDLPPRTVSAPGRGRLTMIADAARRREHPPGGPTSPLGDGPPASRAATCWGDSAAGGERRQERL